MKKRLFISVPSKLLFLILTILLMISAGYSLLSLNRLQDEFKSHQIESLQQAELQFSQQTNQLKEQLIVWLGSLADINQLQNSGDFISLSKTLELQYQNLKMHLNVENIWLTHNNKTLFSTAAKPDYFQEYTGQVVSTQSPLERLVCHQRCLQVISLPLLNDKGEVAVITLTASLLDVLYNMNHLLTSEVAIVQFSKALPFSLLHSEILSASSKPEVTKLLGLTLNDDIINFNALVNDGIFFSTKEKFLLANFIELDEHRNYFHALVLIEDVTNLKLENREYRNQFLLSVFVVFCAVAILIYLVINPFTSRLLLLSKALPKLAKHEFMQFREIDISKNSLFSDEFDHLAESSKDLSLDLEQLNREVEQKTKELENIAMYDLLTGLPNRNMLNYVLKKQLEKLSYTPSKIAVLFLDLDDFKKVNDSHGHGEGDKLLIEAANRVRSSVKAIDLASRFGGDEFVLVLNQINSEQDVIDIANIILAKFRPPIKIDNSIFYVSTSIGIVISDDVDIKADDLISQADIAMYEAKDQGGAQYHIYHNDMYQRVAHRVFMEGEVRQALLKQQFSLSLQPQIIAKDNSLLGFEALLRWKHPERGMISPDDFIPILENSEHMIELGYWVINKCFEIMTVLKALGHGHLRIAINFSAVQFSDPDLVPFLKRLLVQYKLPSQCFELEITEQTLVKDIDKTILVMQELKEEGFFFAIDDFGTGYSSLAYLKKMPVDVIKIDKSFVFGMLENKADHQIIMSTIAMVKNLELKVVAEGVESRAQLRSLADNGCDIIQGYYFSKPIPDVEIYDYIAQNFENGVWKAAST